LAGGIAHDFNNMLAGIMAAAELLKLRLSNDEKNQKMINTIINATTRSADLTRELLTFSRKGKSVSDPVNVNDVITAVMSLLERTVDKKIQLSSRLESGSPFVLGDQTQLQNTLLNLGVNARDAMPDGGALTYSTAVKVLDYATCRSLGISLSPGQYLEIVVSDTGIGMTKELLEHIFEPFFTTKAVGKGTGLGLSAVYGTVHSHNGELSVQSEPGVGSVFKIYIPLLDTVPQPTVCSVEAVSGSGVILLVDDEKLLRDIGSELLESLGYKVYLAENGEQALEVFAEHSSTISLVILDMMMPVMGGKEAFYSLRESSPELKILLCSGFSHDGTGDELVKLGANGFIQKPYNRSELSRSVAAVLGEL
jgi:CheY-like chemotaxis protein